MNTLKESESYKICLRRVKDRRLKRKILLKIMDLKNIK